jgi:hypothetical protein
MASTETSLTPCPASSLFLSVSTRLHVRLSNCSWRRQLGPRSSLLSKNIPRLPLLLSSFRSREHTRQLEWSIFFVVAMVPVGRSFLSVSGGGCVEGRSPSCATRARRGVRRWRVRLRWEGPEVMAGRGAAKSPGRRPCPWRAPWPVLASCVMSFFLGFGLMRGVSAWENECECSAYICFTGYISVVARDR